MQKDNLKDMDIGIMSGVKNTVNNSYGFSRGDTVRNEKGLLMQALNFCILFVRVWMNAEPRILTYACLTKTVCRLEKRSSRFSGKHIYFLYLIC